MSSWDFWYQKFVPYLIVVYTSGLPGNATAINGNSKDSGASFKVRYPEASLKRTCQNLLLVIFIPILLTVSLLKWYFF